MRLLKQAAIFAALVFGLIIAVTAVAPTAAFAQEAATVVVTEPTFLQQLVLASVPIIGLVISALLALGFAVLKQKTGIDVEARHREALQSALLNGILFALQKAGWVAGQPIAGNVLPNLLPTARDYVKSSVPDALKQFGIDAATDAGRATLDRLLTPKLPVAVGTTMPNGDKLIGRAPAGS